MPDLQSMTKEELEKECLRLKEALAEAESANAAKEIFLSNMSHDIRTPMNAIVGMTALAKNHIDEKNRVMDALGKIEVASGHLLSLINDVLDMSRINSGRMRIQNERFQLGDLLHEVLVLVTPLSDQREHEFTFELGNIYRESLYGDALRLRQVYVNIISNAVKYTNTGGKIRVRVFQEEQGDRVVLVMQCEDNGIGMSEEFLQRIFDPFERVNSSTVSGVEGTGLGMSIVKKLVDAMDGTIEIESREGEGTSVEIRTPLQYENVAVHAENLAGKRLLIIEDDEKITARYREYLEDTGISGIYVNNSSAAVSEIADSDYRQEQISAVIIGSRMADGASLFDVAEYFRKAKPGLPILLVGNHRWEEIEYRAERAGIDAFLPLPFFRKSLLLTLSKLLEDKEGAHGGMSGKPDLTGRTILLAEDNLINSEIAKEILESTGASVHTAANGQEALNCFAGSPPQTYALVLMDIQMPVMDGYTAVRAIRQMERPDAQAVPIYAMTANAFAEDIEKARKAGMNGHLSKPIDIAQLMQVLGRIQ